jgi:hypothetical protein
MIVLCQNNLEIRQQIENMSDSAYPSCIRFLQDGTQNWFIEKEILQNNTFSYMWQFIIDNTTEIEYTAPDDWIHPAHNNPEL